LWRAGLCSQGQGGWSRSASGL